MNGSVFAYEDAPHPMVLAVIAIAIAVILLGWAM